MVSVVGLRVCTLLLISEVPVVLLVVLTTTTSVLRHISEPAFPNLAKPSFEFFHYYYIKKIGTYSLSFKLLCILNLVKIKFCKILPSAYEKI
jgi:hypothetical protein